MKDLIKAIIGFLLIAVAIETLLYINVYNVNWQMRGYDLLPTAAPAPTETPHFDNN